MRKYVLNENTVLILNEKVYALVRESEVTNNSVCAKCALYHACVDFDDNHHLSALCMPNEDDGRWFFIDAERLTRFQKNDLRDITSDIMEYL